MKLHESLVKQGCLDGTIEFEAHDRVPFFIVEGVPVIGEEEIECYSETYNGVQYVKMDSTHKNDDDSYSGAEPTYSASMSKERQKLWAEQYELVTVDQMKELRRLDAMWKTLEGAKKAAKEEVKKYFEELGEQGFYSDCLGDFRKFDSDAPNRELIMGQYAAALGNDRRKLSGKDPLPLRWKESGVIVCYPWDDEAIIKLGEDLQQAMQQLILNKELVEQSIDDCKTIEGVKAVLSSVK